MTEKSNRLTLYVPRDLTEAISAEAAGAGISLSELTRYLYAQHLISSQEGDGDTQRSTPSSASEAAFYEQLGRQFYRLALGAVTAHGQVSNPVTSTAHEEETPV